MNLDSESQANEAVIWIRLDMNRNVSTVAALAVRSRVKSIPSSSRRLASLFVVTLITFLTFSLCLCVLERIERCKLMLVRKENEGEKKWMKVRRQKIAWRLQEKGERVKTCSNLLTMLSFPTVASTRHQIITLTPFTVPISNHGWPLSIKGKLIFVDFNGNQSSVMFYLPKISGDWLCCKADLHHKSSLFHWRWMTRAPDQSRWKYGAHRISRCHVPRAVHVWSSDGVLGLFDL